jgi:GNAT superfamily N-acetyltransferase
MTSRPKPDPRQIEETHMNQNRSTSPEQDRPEQLFEASCPSLRIVPLRAALDLAEQAAAWFHAVWGIPLALYQASILACQQNPAGIPQWYVVLDPHGMIVAGLGLIDNDFHKRPDLTPNVCAVFVTEALRGQGIARAMLDYVRRDARRLGHQKLYLLTDHTQFYEKCGWQFLTLVEETGGGQARLYWADTMI